MPSQKKIDQVQELKKSLEAAKSVVLADYCGLTVAKLTQLRREIKQAGGELRVAKNTLIKLALENSSAPEISGPSAVLFAYQDSLTPLKALYEFSQENDRPEIKFGFLDNQFLSQEKILALAQLPSVQELQAKLLCRLNSPLAGLAVVLKANLNKLVMILKEVREKKGGESDG